MLALGKVAGWVKWIWVNCPDTVKSTPPPPPNVEENWYQSDSAEILSGFNKFFLSWTLKIWSSQKFSNCK